MMQDVIGDYDVPEDVPKWKWVVENASFSHRGNGVDAGVWDFMINLALSFDDVPRRLRPVLELARKRGAGYVLFHQGC